MQGHGVHTKWVGGYAGPQDAIIHFNNTLAVIVSYTSLQIFYYQTYSTTLHLLRSKDGPPYECNFFLPNVVFHLSTRVLNRYLVLQ